MSDDYVYVFLHIPRTGGTTINGHFFNHLAFDEEFVHLGGFGDTYRDERDLTPFEERSADERARARVLSGHRVRYGVHELVPGKQPRYITVLRDPANRIVSTYNYRMSIGSEDPQPFEAWYPGYPRNNGFKWLRRGLGVDSFDDVVRMLRTFWFVGATEHLDTDLPRLFRTIGVPDTWSNLRVTPESGTGDTKANETHPFGEKADKVGLKITRRVDVTPGLRERIHADNRRDVRLHQLALRRRTRTSWS